MFRRETALAFFYSVVIEVFADDKQKPALASARCHGSWGIVFGIVPLALPNCSTGYSFQAMTVMSTVLRETCGSIAGNDSLKYCEALEEANLKKIN